MTHPDDDASRPEREDPPRPALMARLAVFVAGAAVSIVALRAALAAAVA
jgi:hypothetical protein